MGYMKKKLKFLYFSIFGYYFTIIPCLIYHVSVVASTVVAPSEKMRLF